jgi:hypothetical protein
MEKKYLIIGSGALSSELQYQLNYLSISFDIIQYRDLRSLLDNHDCRFNLYTKIFYLGIGWYSTINEIQLFRNFIKKLKLESFNGEIFFPGTQSTLINKISSCSKLKLDYFIPNRYNLIKYFNEFFLVKSGINYDIIYIPIIINLKTKSYLKYKQLASQYELSVPNGGKNMMYFISAKSLVRDIVNTKNDKSKRFLYSKYISFSDYVETELDSQVKLSLLQSDSAYNLSLKRHIEYLIKKTVREFVGLFYSPIAKNTEKIFFANHFINTYVKPIDSETARFLSNDFYNPLKMKAILEKNKIFCEKLL